MQAWANTGGLCRQVERTRSAMLCLCFFVELCSVSVSSSAASSPSMSSPSSSAPASSLASWAPASLELLATPRAGEPAFGGEDVDGEVRASPVWLLTAPPWELPFASGTSGGGRGTAPLASVELVGVSTWPAVTPSGPVRPAFASALGSSAVALAESTRTTCEGWSGVGLARVAVARGVATPTAAATMARMEPVDVMIGCGMVLTCGGTNVVTGVTAQCVPPSGSEQGGCGQDGSTASGLITLLFTGTEAWTVNPPVAALEVAAVGGFVACEGWADGEHPGACRASAMYTRPSELTSWAPSSGPPITWGANWAA